MTAAADTSAASATVAAAASTAAAPKKTKTQSLPAASARAASKPAAATASAESTTPTVTCFHTSIQCFRATRKPPAANDGTKPASLDLHEPEIARVFPRAELQKRLPEPGEAEQEVQDTSVQVSGTRELAPVSIGLASIPWAIRHPKQAWRIFTPVTD